MVKMESILKEVYHKRLQLEREFLETQGRIDCIMAGALQIQEEVSPFHWSSGKIVEPRPSKSQLANALDRFYRLNKASRPCHLTSITFTANSFDVSNHSAYQAISESDFLPRAFVHRQISLFLTKMLMEVLESHPPSERFLVLTKNDEITIRKELEKCVESGIGDEYSVLIGEIERDYLEMDLDVWFERSFFSLHLKDFTGENRTAPPILQIRPCDEVTIWILSKELSHQTLRNIHNDIQESAIDKCSIFLDALHLLIRGGFSFSSSDGIDICASVLWPFIKWKGLEKLFRKLLMDEIGWAGISKFQPLLVELQRKYESILPLQ